MNAAKIYGILKLDSPHDNLWVFLIILHLFFYLKLILNAALSCYFLSRKGEV